MSDAELRDHSFEAQEGRWLRFGAWTDGDTPRVVFVVGAEMTSKGAAKAALERGQLVLKHRVWDALARGQRHAAVPAG